MSQAPGRRGSSSVHFVYVRQPLGNPIRARHTYAFGNLLLTRSAFLLSSEKIDRVYRGEMRPEEQRAYIDAMYDFPLADQDLSLHQQMLDAFHGPLSPIPADPAVEPTLEQQMYDLFEGPLTPLPDDSDAEDSISVAGDTPASPPPATLSNVLDLPATPAYTPASPPPAITSFPLSNVRDLPATPALHAADQGDASDSDAEIDELASSASAAGDNDNTPAPASVGRFYTTDGYFAVHHTPPHYIDPSYLLPSSPAASGPYTADGYYYADDDLSDSMDTNNPLPSPTSSESDSESEVDELMSSPSVAAADTGESNTAAPSSPIDSLFAYEDVVDDDNNDDNEADIGTSGPVHRHGFDWSYLDSIDELMGSPLVAPANLDDDINISDSDTTPSSPTDSLFPSEGVDETEVMMSLTGGLSYPADSPVEAGVDLEEFMNSPTGGLGYPADYVESDAEVDELMSSPAPAATDRNDSNSFSDRRTPPLASPARSETSLALLQLLSTPITPASDASMDISSPATPDATPDTSMELEDPFSPPRTPSAGHELNPFAPGFTLRSPLELAPRSGSSIELDQIPHAPPKSPSLSFFRIDRGYKTPDFDQPDSSPTTRPRRLITYLKRDRERYGRPAIIKDHPVDNDTPQIDVGRVEDQGNTEALPTDPHRSRRSRRSLKGSSSKKPTRISRRLLQESANHPSRPGEVLRDAAWYTHYQSYAAVEGRPRPLIDCDGVVMVVISAGPEALQTWWEWVIAHATTLSLGLYRVVDFTHLGSGESVVKIGLLCGPDGPFEIAISGPVGAELARILTSPFFKAISAYHNHMYRLYAPQAFAYLEGQMEKLPVDLPFANSVYTTCELRYGDTPTFDDFNDDTAFDTMDATSVLGLVGGHVTFQEDQIIQQLRVGHTVLAASGSKRINFPTVKKLGRRFLFRQYVDAGVLRWIEKGGRTDKEFEALPEADRAAWVAGRRERAETGLRMFGNIADVVV
ncbi:hypothetical protein R3P38DRAFT_3188937 [Favolaschia claudopus]|uniref:Uncharacterized protein n=1 Tax=Favolaschia claudopus TaxID=2862362 RepID=A0AAW0BUW2_9AGAR